MYMMWNRNFKTVEYNIQAPYDIWWDGRSCSDFAVGRFIKGKFKGRTNVIVCKPEELDKHLRIARTANLRDGRRFYNLSFSRVERLTYRHNKRNRFCSEYWVGSIYIRKYPV